MKLVEKADKNKCRVELVDGGDSLDMLTPSDYKSWIDEIYNNKEEKEKQEVVSDEEQVSEQKPLLSSEV